MSAPNLAPPGRRARLLAGTSDPRVVWVASKIAASRRIDTLDKVYTKLMLGSRAELRGDKLNKSR